MPIFKALTERAEQVRDRYLTLYSRALQAGTARLDDLLKWGDAVSPHLRGLLEGRVERLQHHLDDLNQSLAERAVPVDRKARVGSLSLDSKARKAGQPGLRVVAGTSTARAGETPPVSTPPTSEPGPKKKPKREAGARASTGKRKAAGKAGAAGAAKGNGRARTAAAARARPPGKKASDKTSSDSKPSGSSRGRKPASPKS